MADEKLGLLLGILVNRERNLTLLVERGAPQEGVGIARRKRNRARRSIQRYFAKAINAKEQDIERRLNDLASRYRNSIETQEGIVYFVENQ